MDNDTHRNSKQPIGTSNESIIASDLLSNESPSSDALGEVRDNPNLYGVGSGGTEFVKRKNEDVLSDVHEALKNNPDVDEDSITAKVADGEVTLEGRVEQERQKALAEGMAVNLQGVRKVHNNIEVSES